MKTRLVKIVIGFFLLGTTIWIFSIFQNPALDLTKNSKRLERLIADFSNRSQNFTKTKEFQTTIKSLKEEIMSAGSRKLIPKLGENRMDLQVYVNGGIRFWSTNVGETNLILKSNIGLSIRKFKTGWYLINKINSGKVTFLFFTPVQYQYKVSNQFLKDGFTGDYKIPEFFKLSVKNTGTSQPILSPEKKVALAYLNLNLDTYSQTLKPGQGILLLLVIFCFLYLFYQLNEAAYESKSWLVSILNGVILPLLIFLELEVYFSGHRPINLPIFNSKIFEDLPLFPSLGAFTFLLILLAWLTYFFRNLMPKVSVIRMKENKYFIGIIGFFGIGAASLGFIFLLKSLIYHIKLPLDLTDIFNLNPLIFLVLCLIGFTWLIFYYVLTTIITQLKRLKLFNWENIVSFGLILTATSYFIWRIDNLILSLIIIGFLLFTCFLGQKSRLLYFGISLLMASLITSFEIDQLIHKDEREYRISMARQLANSRDTVTENLLSDIGSDLGSDANLGKFIISISRGSDKELNQEIQKLYFERNFPNYDIQAYVYSANNILLLGPDNVSLDIFLAVSKNPETRKISDRFFQAPGKLGLNNYFGIIPLLSSGDKKTSITLVIRLNARFIRENNSFPILLLDKKDVNNQKSSEYSYAFYKGGSLIDKYGKYPYSIFSKEFNSSFPSKKPYYLETGGYEHLVYPTKPNGQIIVSVPISNLYKQGSLFSYVLCFFILFFGFLIIDFYISERLNKIKSVKDLYLNFTSFRLLYKTRIQVSIVASVFLSLLVIGWITLAYVRNQYSLQQNDFLSNQTDNLREAFEHEVPTDSINRPSENINRQFLDFSAGHAQDLNFYNTQGELLYTSLTKVFDRGLLSQKMAPSAFYQMFVSGRTEFIQNEKIGSLTFLSAYAPIRNNNNQVTGYLNLPYFANQIELRQRLSAFLNSLVNVYLITFLLIGIFSIFLANSLTNPLGLVQKTFGQTKIGKRNQPIPWKRDDEIGDLISEYNTMIQTIEESTLKLAQSERESAWREMAKQVAHEIKNPLTPLKLGVQHLERSWKEKDPNFDEKFKRFNKTFIEQIDSLTNIADEFSNFAKMPLAKTEVVNLINVLGLLINLFKSAENINFNFLFDHSMQYLIFADRDQISRAFTNLIKNGIQSIGESPNGKIEIRIIRIDKLVTIEIEDNGCGIPEEIYPKMFHPNFTTKSSGTGLGLAFVKNVIKQIGGEIRFNSIVNRGTTFIIEIPVD